MTAKKGREMHLAKQVGSPPAKPTRTRTIIVDEVQVIEIRRTSDDRPGMRWKCLVQKPLALAPSDKTDGTTYVCAFGSLPEEALKDAMYTLGVQVFRQMTEPPTEQERAYQHGLYATPEVD
jgi:hypothetical protein